MLKILFAALLSVALPVIAEPLKIGVPVALTGDAAQMGVDQKNALLFANKHFGQGRYELIFEDEKCSAKDGVSAANKLLNLDRVKYALGFTCNGGLLAAAPLYERAGVTLISSCATSGDKDDIGRRIFRILPSDHLAAIKLYGYVKGRFNKVAILTDQDDYAVMLERTMRRLNEAEAKQIEIVSEQITGDDTDYRPYLLKLTKSNPEAIFLNAKGEGSYIRMVKDLAKLQLKAKPLAVYWPASESVKKALGEPLAVTYVNLPEVSSLMSEEGLIIMKDFRREFGEPQAIPLLVPLTIEAFLVLDQAARSTTPAEKYLAANLFSPRILKKFSFDSHGAIAGIEFVIEETKAASSSGPQ